MVLYNKNNSFYILYYIPHTWQNTRHTYSYPRIYDFMRLSKHLCSFTKHKNNTILVLHPPYQPLRIESPFDIYVNWSILYWKCKRNDQVWQIRVWQNTIEKCMFSFIDSGNNVSPLNNSTPVLPQIYNNVFWFFK